jgi:hypothetical protein
MMDGYLDANLKIKEFIMKLNTELIDKLILENQSIVDDITKGNTKAINSLIGKIVSVDVSLGSMESKNYILLKLGMPIQIKKQPKVEEKDEVPKFEIQSRMYKNNKSELCMKSYYKIYPSEGYKTYEDLTLSKNVNDVKVLKIINSCFVKV